jgi:hypothetical protein
MPDITVHRHGERWAVLEAGAESPRAEYPTREAAELAARDLADGGSVEIVDEDPTGLEQAGGEPSTEGGPKLDSVSARERARSPQAGL